MKEKTTKATGYHYKPMPTLYHDEQAERRARHHIEELTAAINEYVEKFRSNGVTIDTEDELRLLTPEVVREQIQATRQRRLGERFLPASLTAWREHSLHLPKNCKKHLKTYLSPSMWVEKIIRTSQVMRLRNISRKPQLWRYREPSATTTSNSRRFAWHGLICARGVLTTTLRHPRKRFYKVLPKAERVPSFLHIFKAACSR